MRKPCLCLSRLSSPLLALASVAVASAFVACSSSRTFRDGSAAGAGNEVTGQAGAPEPSTSRGGSAGAAPVDVGESGSGGAAPVVGDAGGAAVGGDSSCAVARDCTPPDALLCARACVDGGCEFAPTGAVFLTGPDTEDHRTSGFDAAGTPYVFWSDSVALPSSIVLQRLQTDGAAAGVAASYLLPSGTESLRMFDAAFDGDALALMWNAQVPSTEEIVTQFDVTDVGVQPKAPITLSQSQIHSKYPQHAYTQLASPGEGGWLLSEFFGTFPATWRATWVDPESPPSAPPFVEGSYSLVSAPVCSDHGRVPQTAVVLGSTLYVSGFRCDWYQQTECPVSVIVARYDRDTLELLDPSPLELTVSPIAYEPGLPVRAPVLGALADKVVAFWNELSSPTTSALGKAVFNADGSVAKSRAVEPSPLIPKAYVSLSGGRGLLFSSRVDDSVAPALHRLQAQLVNEELEWLGQPVWIDEAREAEPSDVHASLSPDRNRVLVNFRQGRARHRLLHSSLCQ